MERIIVTALVMGFTAAILINGGMLVVPMVKAYFAKMFKRVTAKR